MKPLTPFLWRVIHVAAATYNLLYVYTPLHEWEMGLTTVKLVSMPLLVISGAMLARARRRWRCKPHVVPA